MAEGEREYAASEVRLLEVLDSRLRAMERPRLCMGTLPLDARTLGECVAAFLVLRA